MTEPTLTPRRHATPRQMRPTLERFLAFVDARTENGCWLWTGAINYDGYGAFSVNYRGGQKHHRAHRWAYEQVRGKVPTGLVLDHLCRVRHCVNPWHMEVVTNRENMLRGVSPQAINARKTHCPHGHEFNDENTWRDRAGRRHCRDCTRLRGPRCYQRSASAIVAARRREDVLTRLIATFPRPLLLTGNDSRAARLLVASGLAIVSKTQRRNGWFAATSAGEPSGE